MPSHFSMIGFEANTEEDFVQLAELAAQAGAERIPVRGGHYLHHRDASGAALYVQRVEGLLGTRLMGMHPHFHGEGTMRVRLAGVMASPLHSPMDGSWHAWAQPSTEEHIDTQQDERGLFPFLFDVPDHLARPDVDPTGLATVQVAAFPYACSWWPDEAAYQEAPDDEGLLKLAVPGFVPLGLFASHDSDGPEPIAQLAGTVLASETRTNRTSGAQFHWALVETYGGTVDVVLDAEDHPTAPAVGDILVGAFYLSGRLVDWEKTEAPPEKKGFFTRWFGG